MGRDRPQVIEEEEVIVEAANCCVRESKDVVVKIECLNSGDRTEVGIVGELHISEGRVGVRWRKGHGELTCLMWLQ